MHNYCGSLLCSQLNEFDFSGGSCFRHDYCLWCGRWPEILRKVGTYYAAKSELLIQSTGGSNDNHLNWSLSNWIWLTHHIDVWNKVNLKLWMLAPQTSSTDSTSSLWCDAEAVPYKRKRNQNLNFKWYVSWKIFRTRHPIRLSEVKRQKPSLVQQRNWFVRHHSFQQTMSESFYRFTNFATVYREHILRQ